MWISKLNEIRGEINSVRTEGGERWDGLKRHLSQEVEWLTDNEGGMEIIVFPNSATQSVSGEQFSLWIFTVFVGDRKSTLHFAEDFKNFSLCSWYICNGATWAQDHI